MEIDINYVTNLARLKLTEAEKAKYQAQLGSILDYINKLSEAKTDGVETADGGTRNLENIWRKDKAVNNKQQTINKELIKQAPSTENGQVKVKSVF
jgi:aspartyl/glutamyl-tRNA(Asn/Gln) amidotransferase C subunit